MQGNKINLSHGGGGKASQRLIGEVFNNLFSNPILDKMEDSALLPLEKGEFIFTTDSFVVSPIFFPGGDIGKISICGTVNDLTAMGAVPKYLSISFILEEGLDFLDLEKICISIKKTCKEAKVKIVTGDTKVVEKGNADKIFITTSGIGYRNQRNNISIYNVKAGDNIIINGTVGDHGLAILNARQNMKFTSSIISDCAPLNNMIRACLDGGCRIHAMRDATRGGLATVLNEITEASGLGIEIDENRIPVNNPVRSFCEILGLDPLYLANEGKMVIFTAKKDTEKCLKLLKNNKYGKYSAVIGKVTKESGVFLKTSIGGKRPLIMLEGDQLPRIC